MSTRLMPGLIGPGKLAAGGVRGRAKIFTVKRTGIALPHAAFTSSLRLAFFCAFAATLAACAVDGMGPGGGANTKSTQVRSQPGFYRIPLGDFVVTALSDGTIPLPFDKFAVNAKPGEVETLVKRGFQTLPVETSINAYLIDTGTRLLLVDTGAGELFLPAGGGKLFASLKAAGYRPEQIDDILLTHVHADHSGGLVVGGKIMFPTATIHVNQSDLDHWFSAEQEADAPANQKHSFAQGRASLDPYIAAGHVKTFVGTATILPGITTMPTPGHTPGHTSFRIENKGQTLVFWGDTVHVAEVQFPDPSVSIDFDVDPNRARVQREAEFMDAAKNGYLVAGAHVAFPGLGHVRLESFAYSWVPVDYSIRVTSP